MDAEIQVGIHLYEPTFPDFILRSLYTDYQDEGNILND